MSLASLRRHSVLIGILLLILLMVGLVSFSVPLYRAFCSYTGAGGTTQRVARDDAAVSARVVTVFFNTDVAPGLPWRFRPLQRSVTVHLGQLVPVYFEAANLSDDTLVGHATFNVTPDKAGQYFKKVQCFCFSEERLGPHQIVQMPVQFFVDPAIAKDANAQDVDQITLSYTFFASKSPNKGEDLARLQVAAGPGDARRGAEVFAENCAACHALDVAHVGPPLRGVVGRAAGSVSGYPYSAALAHSGVIWTPDRLTAWLIDPQTVARGALMPKMVTDAQMRADLIAYLQAAATVSP